MGLWKLVWTLHCKCRQQCTYGSVLRGISFKCRRMFVYCEQVTPRGSSISPLRFNCTHMLQLGRLQSCAMSWLLWDYIVCLCMCEHACGHLLLIWWFLCSGHISHLTVLPISVQSNAEKSKWHKTITKWFLNLALFEVNAKDSRALKRNPMHHEPEYKKICLFTSIKIWNLIIKKEYKKLLPTYN